MPPAAYLTVHVSCHPTFQRYSSSRPHPPISCLTESSSGGAGTIWVQGPAHLVESSVGDRAEPSTCPAARASNRGRRSNGRRNRGRNRGSDGWSKALGRSLLVGGTGAITRRQNARRGTRGVVRAFHRVIRQAMEAGPKPIVTNQATTDRRGRSGRRHRWCVGRR